MIYLPLFRLWYYRFVLEKWEGGCIESEIENFLKSVKFYEMSQKKWLDPPQCFDHVRVRASFSDPSRPFQDKFWTQINSAFSKNENSSALNTSNDAALVN
jgi:hypothetical protein